MASIYRKKHSPFWFIQFIDADGTRRNKSTGLRADNPGETVKARALRAQLEAKELSRTAGEVSGGSWDTWVPQYLERHCETARTLERYTDSWKWLAFWLQEKHYHSPRAITYRNALEYIDWRTTYKKKTGKTVGRNTAIMELKLLAMIMGEAVRLGHADANPLVSLKLKRDKAAKKPELTDEEISEIREALKDEPEWMQTAFDISLHTGCRLRETRIPLNCIDFKEDKITFPSPKGGEDRAFSIPMPSALRPLLERTPQGETEIHGGISVSTVAAVAAILYQDQETAFVFPLPAGHLCQPAASRGRAARSGDAAGQSCFGIDSSNLPARESRRCGAMA